MTETDEYRLWLSTQRRYLQGLLAEYRSGSRTAVYTLRDGRRIDETGAVIAQLEADIRRLEPVGPAKG